METLSFSLETVGHAAPSGTDKMHLDRFEGDEDDWYIMDRALECGADPQAVLNEVRAAQRQKPPAQPQSPGAQGDRGGWGRKAAVAEAAGAALPWPPGRAGRFAQFIFDRSYSPVREVAIAATLGLLAGVCGRAYRTYSGKDLALYLILVARSGIGKDSTHDSIPLMLKLASVPLADRFVRAQDFVSGEALHKELLREPGFLALQGEFGRKLKRMSNPIDTPMQNLRTVMTNAYGKQYFEGKSYSNADNRLSGVDWPALSFLGETTPSTFLECLTPDMMADGFLSRFLCVTYEGDRPPPNRDRDAELDPEDLAAWRTLVSHMVSFQSPINIPATCTAVPNEDAQYKLESFELDCIDDLNATDDESERQVWSRAHLKALKVASLLAVADHCFNPVVRIEHVAWALNLVRQDIALFQSRKRSGDIGTDDDARERKLIAFMKEYLLNPVPPSYKVPSGMREIGIVTRAYLQVRASSLPAFANHRFGKVKAVDDALRSLLDSGYIVEVKGHKLVEDYRFHGKAFRIVRMPG
ncbi:DUF3987 domain-containing protein [Hoeflea sp.]|uniref:DUF3987 domain-containing protein n=1 Tax=Hyphomicrobiales TaxID=356 RepID=UPI003A95109C